jgi:nickel/cobalt transporter (NicO) family protein
MNFPILSTFLLGALHSLEPGHGKSIVALHTSRSRKLSDGFSLLASLLLTHFLLVIAISFYIYFNPSVLNLVWLKYLAPVLVIIYGLFLLIKSRKDTDEYLGCSCSHEEKPTDNKNQILVGIMAGLTPCPSVFAPVILCMSNQQFDQIFYYLIAHIAGVISVFVILFLGVFFIKNSSQQLETLVSKFNPHLMSGIMMVLIGIFYLAMGLMHQH